MVSATSPQDLNFAIEQHEKAQQESIVIPVDFQEINTKFSQLL